MRNSKDIAEFIRTMTVELTDLARGANLQALGVILSLASLEAKRAVASPRDHARRKPQGRGGGAVTSSEARRNRREPRVAAR